MRRCILTNKRILKSWQGGHTGLFGFSRKTSQANAKNYRLNCHKVSCETKGLYLNSLHETALAHRLTHIKNRLKEY